MEFSKWYRLAVVDVVVDTSSSRGRQCRMRWSRFFERHWDGNSRLESVQSYDKCRTRCIPRFFCFLFPSPFYVWKASPPSIPTLSLPAQLSVKGVSLLLRLNMWHSTVPLRVISVIVVPIYFMWFYRVLYEAQFRRWQGETIENRKKGKGRLSYLRARIKAHVRYSCIFRSVSFCSRCA